MCGPLVDPGAHICLPSDNHLSLHIQPAGWMLIECILARACPYVKLWGLRGEQGQCTEAHLSESWDTPPSLSSGCFFFFNLRAMQVHLLFLLLICRDLLTFYIHYRHLSSEVKYFLCKGSFLSADSKGLS